ncbi:syntaxin-71 [Cinnamomum micranthum f. kanehirae]|uniref:Syntaxin-71 n=1 Tax=Cinnamomum micranthum f. kanehirae TaxID=337451 RepID=A0A443PLL1_9MAGN|nr:syntaxin-71 [Cinnamomum micranthum f. kanehirae]
MKGRHTRGAERAEEQLKRIRIQCKQKPVNPGPVVSASHFFQQPNFAPKANDQTNKEEEALPSDQKEEEEEEQELLLKKKEKKEMSLIDILTRVDAVCKKYEKYDVEKQRDFAGDDAFARLFAEVEDEIEAAIRKSEDTAKEKNRAAAVAMSAEIRRTKARLLEHVPKLQKLAVKKVKGLSSEELATRSDLVLALPDRIKEIPDGSTTGAKNAGGSAASGSRPQIKFDSPAGLDIISEGLDTLKNLAHDMNEELDRQVPLIDEIDTKVDRANADLKNTNVRLKETIDQMRSSRNFCVDIILICIILGIVMYLFNILRN